MPWFKIDDGFHSHPKVIAAGNAAIGLWARCGSWSSDQLTDGFVPAAVARMYGTAAEAKALVREGLWEIAEGGYLTHDFHDFNPTAETVRAERDAAAERQRRHREQRRASQRDSDRDEQGDLQDRNGVSSPSPIPSRSRPVSNQLSAASSESVPLGAAAAAAIDLLIDHRIDTLPPSKKPSHRAKYADTIRRGELATHGAELAAYPGDADPIDIMCAVFEVDRSDAIRASARIHRNGNGAR